MSPSGFLILLISVMSCGAAPSPENDRCQKPEPIHRAQLQGLWNDETYPHGKVANFACLPEYTQEGPIKMACIEGTWFPFAKGQCKEIRCKPPVIDNGEVINPKMNGYNDKAAIQFTCNEGFTPSTSREVSCNKDVWSPTPSCNEIVCSRYSQVEKGKLIGTKARYRYGEETDVECEDGYVLQREPNKRRRCTSNGWSPPSRCVKIGTPCGPPPVVQFGDTKYFAQSSYKSGDSVEYMCPAYYILKGNKIVRCLNGVWDEAPVCLEPCTVMIKDMNGNNIQLRWKNDEKLYSVHGDYIAFMCKSGYEAPPDTQMRIVCKEGKLEYPKCFKTGYCVLDQQTMITNNIHYNVSTVLDPGERITFQCNGGMVPEDKLEAKCEWKRINYPKCIAPKSCKTPEILNGFLRSEQQASYDSGSHVEFQCNEDYVINGPIKVKCEDGEWTDLPVCLSPCKVSTEDLTKHNIQLLPSADPKSILDRNHRDGTEFSVTCKSGFRRPNPAALVIECYDGKFRYPRCFSGETCRIDQDKLDENNLELDEVHDNEVYYQEGETIRYKCKSGFYSRGKPTGTCSERTLNYPRCIAGVRR